MAARSVANTVVGRPDRVPSPFQFAEGASGMLDQYRTVTGRDHPLAGPLEQDYAKFVLQRADLP